MSLSERAADISRTIPNKKISPSTISRIYKKNYIKKKKVKVTKIPNKKEKKKITRAIQQAKDEL